VTPLRIEVRLAAESLVKDWGRATKRIFVLNASANAGSSFTFHQKKARKSQNMVSVSPPFLAGVNQSR
jgi:hypothetical protein